MTTLTIAAKQIILTINPNKVNDTLIDEILDQFEADLLDFSETLSSDLVSVAINDAI